MKIARVNAPRLPILTGPGGLGGASQYTTSSGLPWFIVTDYGAVGDGATDDTSAIQDTIDAATAAGGGVVYFPPGTYLVGGALQDTGAFNGQILLPNVDHADPHIVLVFLGALRPGLHPVYGTDITLDTGHAIVSSTLTGASGTAAVFSGGNNLAAPSSGGGNNLEVFVEDLVCLAVDNPTFTFWNLSACQGGGFHDVQVSHPGGFSGSPVEPTHSNSYGVKLPQKYFSNYTETTGLSVGGYYTCILNGERADHRGLILGNCIVGIEQPAMFFASVIHSVQLTSFQYGIRASGGDSRLDVIDYSAEHTTSPTWKVTVYDLDDASDNIYGYIRWQNAVTGGTLDSTFTKNSGANVLDQEKGPTWGGGGGGDVATDPIWDAAGDLAVGTGADAAARLAIGNAGGRLSRINGAVAWNSRTSMPTAATGDVVYRTDLKGEWFYDGSIWLSLAAFQLAFPFAILPPLTGTGVGHRMGMPGALGGSDVYLAAVIGGFYVAGGTALSGSHKWVGTVSKTSNAGATSLGTITIDSGASDQWRALPVLSIAAAAAVGSGFVAFEINWVKTGTPGDLYADPILAFRTIAT